MSATMHAINTDSCVHRHDTKVMRIHKMLHTRGHSAWKMIARNADYYIFHFKSETMRRAFRRWSASHWPYHHHITEVHRHLRLAIVVAGYIRCRLLLCGWHFASERGVGGGESPRLVCCSRHRFRVRPVLNVSK